jgi:bifunctional ADP-heptose synthase (sugar kinase/adenylyltransferase)
MRTASSKIGTLDEVRARVETARAGGRRVALASGAFELLDVGRIRSLQEARDQADLLVVAVHGDALVRGLGVPGRPLLPEGDRATLVAALRPVDHVVVVQEGDWPGLRLALRPDVLCPDAPETDEARDLLRRIRG